MSQQNRIKELPDDLYEMVNRLLREGRETQQRILALVNADLEQRGEEPISKSGFNRYAQNVAKIGERIRQSREVASIWVGKLGEVPEGHVGRLLLETVRTLAFETTNELANQETPPPPKVLNELAKMARNLELAMSTNAQREIEIKAQARKEAEKDAADKAVAVGKEAGLSEETIEMIRSRVLGV